MAGGSVGVEPVVVGKLKVKLGMNVKLGINVNMCVDEAAVVKLKVKLGW